MATTNGRNEMTKLQEMAHEQDTAPTWKLAARASREFSWLLKSGDEVVDRDRHVLSPSRCLELVKLEWENVKSQGCTRIEVYLQDELVHVEE